MIDIGVMLEDLYRKYLELIDEWGRQQKNIEQVAGPFGEFYYNLYGEQEELEQVSAIIYRQNIENSEQLKALITVLQSRLSYYYSGKRINRGAKPLEMVLEDLKKLHDSALFGTYLHEKPNEIREIVVIPKVV